MRETCPSETTCSSDSRQCCCCCCPATDTSRKYLDLVEIADVFPPSSDDGNFTFMYEHEESIESVWQGIHEVTTVILFCTFFCCYIEIR